jgi:predicted enzyme related to lactoylglutathione lyase
MPNPICHIEIPCNDLTRATQFYREIFGWTVEPSGETYVMFNTGEGVAGGLDLRRDKVSSDQGITLYIEVRDIPAYLKKIEDAGCSILKEKTEISKDFGYFALFNDSEGNVMGLWAKE